MQLTKIKLAGFKSFVEPTVVFVPTRLMAIVGPNGCGKSNIIDAVCWVLGENSARLLRGESLSDVIFNGSSERKPVGQASVELVFDNSDGTLGGQYAAFSEISVKRVITREDSAYFLNGTRCRRRDIIDIFLGTGLGPRSYAIIGQNMIQRIIEAKPDEMRTYLEEAAGVSKYKERRRETENRIQHTQENLTRLNDVRAELEKQLNSLKRQSTAAEKFKLLKEEERRLKAEWLTIQWRQLDARLVAETLQIQQQSTGLESRQAERGDLDLQLEYKRDSHRLAYEQHQEVQRHYYAIGNDVTRLEQEIQHHQARKQQLQSEYDQIEKDWSLIKNQLEESEHECEDLLSEIEALEPQVERNLQSYNEKTNQLKEAENAYNEWQSHWDHFNQDISKNTRSLEVEQTHLQHLEQKITMLAERQKKLAAEEKEVDFSNLENHLAALSAKKIEVTQQINAHNLALQETYEEIKHFQQIEQDTGKDLDNMRNALQILNGKEASLQSLQETALGKRHQESMHSLKTLNLDNKKRLGQNLKVAAGWEKAVEKVLGPDIQAVCVDHLTEIFPHLEALNKDSLSFVSKGDVKETFKKESLLSKVDSDWSLVHKLAHVYTASSHQEAFNISHTLKPYESIITQDGLWVSRDWVSISGALKAEEGVLQREQELKDLSQKIKATTKELQALEKKLHDTRQNLVGLKEEHQDIQKKLNGCMALAAELAAEDKMQQSQLSELKKRVLHINQDQTACQEELKKNQEELSKIRNNCKRTQALLEKQSLERENLTRERVNLRETLQNLRENVNQLQEAQHQDDIRLQTAKSQHSALQHTQTRLQQQLDSLSERKACLHIEINASSSIEFLQKDLENALKSRLLLQGDLTSARQALEMVNQELQDLEQKRHEIDREVARFRDMLEALRIEWQGIKVKSDNLIEQITQEGFHLETILQELPEVTSADEWKAKLEQVSQRIARLGAINLVAIDEFAACSERKEYLDKQYNDLQEGLTTLENAIAKIDKETRTRLKQTFDRVNERFQELFPMVFGGGKASLELTGENLLDAGVTVMACPPGKRNSTIHLLSGGEKALTAIALVFSIFHLNPAPFCLLDEVDAPLDDANISRFCQLVKKMSEKTQFIYISHNKLAMEMAESLIGVTMNEPGVSRLVSVDVKQAMALAGV